MERVVESEKRCECGRMIAQRQILPDGQMIRNALHRQSIVISAAGISLRGRCPSCSRLHTILYAIETRAADLTN